MTEIQILNLIRFCSLFRSEPILKQSPDYIMEKWDKYIDIKISQYKIATKSTGMIIGLSDYKTKWGINKNIEYSKIGEIINFIEMTYERDFGFDPNDDSWTTSELLELFSKCIGSPKRICNEPGPKIHFLLEKYIENWLESTMVKRDYRLILLGV